MSSTTISAPTPPLEPARTRRHLAATLAAWVLVAGFYLWTASALSNPFQANSGREGDYYNLLTDGFLAGHLYMAATPHPGLLSPDPAVRARAPYLLDASLYEGRYYLYFGVAPVLLLFLPWTVVTGHDISEGLATAVFASAGFLLGVALLWRMRRRYFPGVGLITWLSIVIAFACCTMAPAALRRGAFYEIAVCSAFAGAMLFFHGALRALETPERPGKWLVVAGLGYVLAVGSRANLVFSGLLLPVVAWAVWRRSPAAGRSPGALFRALLAACIPAALGLGGLMTYNFLRFNNPFDFGHAYQVVSNLHGFPFRPAFLWHNLKTYYLSLPEFSRYFPFFYPGPEGGRPDGYWGIEHVHPQFFAPLLLFLVVPGAWMLRRHAAAAGPVLGLLGILTGWFFLNGAIVGLTGVRADRYLIDFQPALVLAAAIAVMTTVHRPPAAGRRIRFAAAALLGFASFYDVMASMQLHEYFRDNHPATYSRVARFFNHPSWWLQRLLGDDASARALRLRVVFPEKWRNVVEPLVATGTPWFSDLLYVEDQGNGAIRFGLDHQGHGGPVSAPVPIQPGKAHELTVRLGSLFPPVDHPFFADFSRTEAGRIKQSARVELDGETVFSAGARFYDASPGQLYIGRNPLEPTPIPGPFSGRITLAGRLPSKPADLIAGHRRDTGPLHLRLQFPLTHQGSADPLVSTGEPGRADVLYVEYLDSARLRLGLDHWGGDSTIGPAMAVDYSRPHELEVHMGSLYAAAPAIDERLRQLLLVRLDDRVALAARTEFHDADPLTVFTGYNSAGSSVCRMFFGGPIDDVRRLQSLEQRAQAAEFTSPQLLTLALNRQAAGQVEPIFRARDHTGGFLLGLIRYRDGQSIELGVHWHGATQWGDPIPVDYDRPHELVIGTKWPDGQPEPAGGGWLEYARHQWRKGLRLYLDGRFVLESESLWTSMEAGDWLSGDSSLIAEARILPVFSGTLTSAPAATRLAAFPPDWTTAGGVLQLEIKLPSGFSGRRQPLITTGRTGAGDALYVEYIDDRHVRFGFDHWGVGGPTSPPVEVNHQDPLLITVRWAPERALLGVAVAGRDVWDGAVLYHRAEGPVHIGANPIGFSSCEMYFEGEILSCRFEPLRPLEPARPASAGTE